MLQEMLTNYVMMYLIFALGGIGVIMKFLLGIKYSVLLKDTHKVGTEKCEWINVLKKKYEICHKLDMNVYNVDNFVDKYVYKQKWCGIFLYTWENICGKLCVLCGALSVIAMVLAVYTKCGQAVIVEYFTEMVFSLTLLITFSMLANVSKKKEVIHLLLCEYLENVYDVRLETERVNPQLFEQFKVEMNKLEQVKVKKKAKKAKTKKSSQRDEIERMKQELVAELKQERLENEKKRLLEKQQEQEEKQKEDMGLKEIKKEEKKEEKKAVAHAQKKPPVHAERKQEEREEEKDTDKEQILQDILREYLGEING